MSVGLLLLVFHKSYKLNSFFDGGLYRIESSPLICSANLCTVFYMIGTSVMKE